MGGARLLRQANIASAAELIAACPHLPTVKRRGRMKVVNLLSIVVVVELAVTTPRLHQASTHFMPSLRCLVP